MKDENDTTTGDLLNSPDGPVLAIAGFGTGTVAELEHYIDQLHGERDAARRALADLERRTNGPDADDGALLVYVITRIAERAAERAAARAAERAAGEIDGAAIWAEIEYRVEEAAADAARDVIRNELVVNVDLI